VTQPVSYPMGAGGISPGIKQLGCEADNLSLMLRLRMVELHLHYPICLHDIVISSGSTSSSYGRHSSNYNKLQIKMLLTDFDIRPPF
jgi:hypothetical protein